MGDKNGIYCRKRLAITIDGTALTSYVDSMSLSRDINTLTVTSFGDDNEAYSWSSWIFN